MRPTLELMKCLGLIKRPKKNKKFGSIDYLVKNKDSKRLVRAMIDENNNAAPVYVDTIRSTIQEIEEKEYSEAIIISKRITNSAYELVTQVDNLNVITPNTKNNFSLIEVLSAIQSKTRELCKIKCGKAPETKQDCTGKKGRIYDCDIRRISDDATFHATMKWKTVLLEDFNNLCEIEKEMEATPEVN